MPYVETEGIWQIDWGKTAAGKKLAPTGNVEALTYSNPFGQNIEKVWFEGLIVFATELGAIPWSPAVKVAQEYQIVYDVALNAESLPIRVERVPGQYNIYDSVPGMSKYSPLWQMNYVVVPRGYPANYLKSEADCMRSGYRIVKSKRVVN